jgi:hypothetical protein
MDKPDPIAQRVRRCCHCGGDMLCKTLTQWKQRGNDAGREYLFVCQGCKKMVTELGPGRAFLVWLRIVCGVGLAAMMVYFGLKMLLSTIAHGFGGNQPSAIIVVLVLFLGLGLPFLGAMLWWGRATWRDTEELKRNPIVR